jgi:hypothetical protein
MTTAVESSQRGQSVIEFLLLLPMLVGLVVIMLRVNTAIQVSIVNQQYARAQTLFLTMNHHTYPDLYQRVPNFDPYGFNQMMLGVAEETLLESTPENQHPSAPTQNVTRRPSRQDDDAQQEPPERGMVRIRNTITLCTQPNVIRTRKGYEPILPLRAVGNASNRYSVTYAAAGPYNLPSGAFKFEYCRSPFTDGGTVSR